MTTRARAATFEIRLRGCEPHFELLDLAQRLIAVEHREPMLLDRIRQREHGPILVAAVVSALLRCECFGSFVHATILNEERRTREGA